MPNQQPTQKRPPYAPEEAVRTVNRFIRETDWDAFWTRVTERTAPQIDAYEKARVKSLETAPQHVFM